MLNDVILEFGQRMDIPDLCLDEFGVLMLEIESIGTLNLELDQDANTLFICLSLPYPAYETDMASKILELCSYEHGHEIAFRGGIYDGLAVLMVSVESDQINVATLENILHFLSDKLSKLFN